MDEKFQITDNEREKVLKNYFRFGVDGPLDTFPSKEKRKYIVAEKIAKRFEMGKIYMEKEVNELLKQIYPDFATIRRFLIDYGFMNRSDDGVEYWVEGEQYANHYESEKGTI